LKDPDCLKGKTIEAYLDELASAAPTPGGGSAAALVAALAASLGLMVVAVGGKRGDEPRLSEIATHLRDLRASFLQLASEDEEAFRGVLASYRLPKDDLKREGLIEISLQEAAAVPIRLAEGCIALLDRLIELAPLSPRQIASDVGAACHLARGAIDSALLNVIANIAYMHDNAAIAKLKEQRSRLSSLSAEMAERAVSLVIDRIG